MRRESSSRSFSELLEIVAVVMFCSVIALRALIVVQLEL